MSARSATAHAPVRIADVGGWTDTWFGAPGEVCSLAVGPGATAHAELAVREPPRRDAGPAIEVELAAPDLGWRGVVRCSGPDPAGSPGPTGGLASGSEPGPHGQPLLEHAVAAVVDPARLPAGARLRVSVTSAVPPGASLGTSAAVVVALLAALDALHDGAPRSAEALAVLAHRVETERAGREAGVQDQWAAAVGGANHLAVGPYPEVRRRPVPLDAGVRAALADRVVTVALGAHDSSAVHGEVILALVSCDGDAHERARRALRELSTLAGRAADALGAGDVDAWAAVLTEATEGQRRLHPGLVGEGHEQAIAVARAAGAVGWKVNGAGGAGGSLTAVAPPAGADGLRAALAAADPAWRVLDLAPADGVSVRVSPPA